MVLCFSCARPEGSILVCIGPLLAFANVDVFWSPLKYISREMNSDGHLKVIANHLDFYKFLLVL